jgi:hypothetical protein
MRTRVKWTMILLVWMTYPACAFSQVTAALVIAAAAAAGDKLNSIAGNLGADGRSVANGANGTINGAIQELKNMVDDLNKPVNTLSDNAQNLARTIQNMTNDLNDLINVRTTCAFEGADRFVYGVKTLTSQLQNAIPFIKDAKPYVYSFQFNGHTEGVVPEGGGRLSISGFSLWNGGLSPQVTFVDENRKPVKALDAGRGNDDNSVSVQLDSSVLDQFTGRCGEIEIVPRVKKGFLGGTKAGDPEYLSICVPPTNKMAFRVKANTDFMCTTIVPTHTLNYENFRCDNASCEQQLDCNVQHSWVIPPGCTVVGLDKRKSEERNSTWMNFTYVGGNVQANGKIDTAQCVDLHIPFVNSAKLLATTIWSWDAAPQIQCTASSWVPSERVSEPTGVSTNSVPVCVDLPRACDTDQTASTAEVDLLQAAHEHAAPADLVPIPAITTPKLTLNSKVAGNFQNIDYEGMTLKGTVNPVAGSMLQTCVTVTVQKCGY